MQRCPICSAEIENSEIICATCMEKVRLNEPRRREEKIRNVADMLVIVLAIFLFFKGGYGLLAVEGYKGFAERMGFPATSDALHYWNASICILAALGYAVTAFGNYLGLAWTLKSCRFTLLFFLIGQLVIQIGDISDEFITAEALSVVFFLGAVPVLQYVMVLISRRAPEGTPPAP